ncbi:MAG: pyruvate kinase alpha/beta domain-containing protein [Thermoanaerobacteraceae bacterium]|nr:pyruvate kinase alpha/beta domain-containing protein [Thermoanaerobacteraceae bacterium]
MTLYWPSKGSANTSATVAAALSRARELGLEHIVVASCSGATAARFIGSGFNVVCVTHQVGFESPGVDEMPPEMRERLTGAGVKVLTTTHLMAGLDRALRFKFGGIYPAEVIAAALRMFGQGVKVGVEISVMALDAGLVPVRTEVVAVAGTGSGADTALVVEPAHSQHFFDTKIREIICKPRDF